MYKIQKWKSLSLCLHPVPSSQNSRALTSFLYIFQRAARHGDVFMHVRMCTHRRVTYYTHCPRISFFHFVYFRYYFILVHIIYPVIVDSCITGHGSSKFFHQLNIFHKVICKWICLAFRTIKEECLDACRAIQCPSNLSPYISRDRLESFEASTNSIPRCWVPAGFHKTLDRAGRRCCPLLLGSRPTH